MVVECSFSRALFQLQLGLKKVSRYALASGCVVKPGANAQCRLL
jgi:hypothetical protein